MGIFEELGFEYVHNCDDLPMLYALVDFGRGSTGETVDPWDIDIISEAEFEAAKQVTSRANRAKIARRVSRR